jgi:hypothetical protein
MQRQGASRHWEVAYRAAKQHGVVSRDQLLAAGFGLGSIDNAVRTGRLHAVYRGVYAVGHPNVGAGGRRTAAVLACGPAAVLSHRTAGDHWGVLPSASARIHVTTTRSRGVEGINVHRVRAIHPADRTVHNGIPVTTVARTLLDLAEIARPRELERAIDRAERLELLDLSLIGAVCARSPGRHGLKPLNRALDDLIDPPITKSELERMFLDLCRAYGIPLPMTNVPLLGWEVDAYWPDHNVVVELDGYEWHKTRADFERDRLKQERLQVAGLPPLRFTYRRIRRHPRAVAASLQAVLAR